MAGPRLLRAIHVVGYLTTVVVIVGIAALGYQLWASGRSRSRMHDRPLAVTDAAAAKSYEPVRPPAGESDDALGYVSMPGLLYTWYAASIRLPRGSDVARGEIVFIWHGDRSVFSRVQTFTLPKRAYLVTSREIDALTDGWRWNEGGDDCLDGVEVAFERTKAGRVTSGIGNAACNLRYTAIDHLVDDLLQRFGPKPPVFGRKPPTADNASVPASAGSGAAE